MAPEGGFRPIEAPLDLGKDGRNDRANDGTNALSVSAMDAARDALLAWSAQTLRDLPWRRTRDPWAVLVSETMLQQTQVSRVAPAYEAWMARWPAPADLATARTAEIIRAWRGLGYNRRALRLQAAAATIVDRHQGEVPDDLASLLALPGIGPYTARAVLAFAFEKDVGVLDTNAARIIARAFAGQRLTTKEAQALAAKAVPGGRSWAWNSGMLDLGATVCTAGTPLCDACPLAAADACAWRNVGGPDPAIGTAGASGQQSRFAGSDRQGRGRLVAALRSGALRAADVPLAAGWPDDPARAERAMETLLADGLAVRIDGVYRLPE